MKGSSERRHMPDGTNALVLIGVAAMGIALARRIGNGAFQRFRAGGRRHRHIARVGSALEALVRQIGDRLTSTGISDEVELDDAIASAKRRAYERKYDAGRRSG